MKTNRILVLIAIFSCFGCHHAKNNQDKSRAVKDEQDSILIIVKPYKNSRNVTEYEIPVLRGTNVRHGIQKRYYLHGSLYSEIPYIHGKREGVAKTYYPAAVGKTPVVWKEQPYKNNVLNGICHRYHRNGKLQAEYEYKNGLPAVGLKEFNPSGKPVNLPVLTLSKSNANVYYYLNAQMSGNTKNVDYFIGDLIEGKYMPKTLKGLQVKNGAGEILLPLDTKKATITAVMYTDYKNQYIVSKSISF